MSVEFALEEVARAPAAPTPDDEPDARDEAPDEVAPEEAAVEVELGAAEVAEPSAEKSDADSKVLHSLEEGLTGVYGMEVMAPTIRAER